MHFVYGYLVSNFANVENFGTIYWYVDVIALLSV